MTFANALALGGSGVFGRREELALVFDFVPDLSREYGTTTGSTTPLEARYI